MNSNQPRLRSVQNRKRVAVILLFVLAAFFLPACTSSKKEAEALVKEGASKSQQLADYYDSLIQKENDYLTISSYTVGFKVSDNAVAKTREEVATEANEITKEKKAYAARAELARQLKATYDALGKLIDSGAPGEVKGAVDDLLTAVLKQVPHPGDLDSDLFKTVVGKIAGKLVEIQQEKQFRKNVPRVLEVLDGIAEIFEMERGLYTETVTRYEQEASVLARQMAVNPDPGADQGTGMGVMQKFVEPYGVKMFVATVLDPAVHHKNAEFVGDRIEQQAKHDKDAAFTQARSMSNSLYALVRSHRVFLNAAPAAPLLKVDEVTNLVRLSTILKQALIAREEWEKQESNRTKSDEKDKAKPFQPASDMFISDYVVRLLSPAVKDGLRNGDSSAKFRKSLVADLNRVIDTGSIVEGILSDENTEALIKFRTFVVGKHGDGSKDDRRALLEKFRGEIITKMEAEHNGHSGDRSSPVPSELKLSIRLDPAGKALARLNRDILAFVYKDMIAAA